MTSPTPQWLPWRTAMQQALYGPGGFFTRERPADHFSTSVHVSPLYAQAVAELLCRVDSALGHPADLVFTDMAAGRGELCAGVLDALPSSVAARVRAYAVELAPRPAGLDPRITWAAQPPGGVRGLLFANEWLDNVPLDVAEAGEDGTVRYVEVSTADGAERLGARVGGADERWLRRWWPRMAPGGAPRSGGPGTRRGPPRPAPSPTGSPSPSTTPTSWPAAPSTAPSPATVPGARSRPCPTAPATSPPTSPPTRSRAPRPSPSAPPCAPWA